MASKRASKSDSVSVLCRQTAPLRTDPVGAVTAIAGTLQTVGLRWPILVIQVFSLDFLVIHRSSSVSRFGHLIGLSRPTGEPVLCSSQGAVGTTLERESSFVFSRFLGRCLNNARRGTALRLPYRWAIGDGRAGAR